MRRRLPQALGAGHGATRMLVVPGAIPERSAAFAVAGCSGYVLDSRARAGRRAGGGMSAASLPARPRPRARPSESRLPIAVARMPAFLALAGFGAYTGCRWSRRPRPDAMLAALVAAARRRAC